MPELRPYQVEGVDFLLQHRHALLAFEMRLGKSGCAVRAAYAKGARSIVVVCPAIAVPHWRREFEKWWLNGTAPRLAVMSYDRARSLWQAGLSGTTDVFIPDECHMAKNPEANRTRMVYGKTGFAQKAGATWALSGTPAPRHAGELWPMLRAFGVVGMDYESFTRRYCTYNDFTGRITGTKEKHIPELKALLARIMLRRTRKEVAPDMPAIGFEFLEMDGFADYKNVAGLSDQQIEQVIDGVYVVDEDSRIEVAKAKAKQLAVEIVDSINNKLYAQTVVFGWHKEPLRGLTDELCRAGIHACILTGETHRIAREITQQGFKAGAVQVICANILAAGTAIDLSAASHGYFLELDWVSGNNLQAANRLISMDKKEPVTFDICTWPGSVDDRIQRVLVRRVKELAQLY